MWNRNPDSWNSVGLDGPGSGPVVGPGVYDNPMKRKLGEDPREVHGLLERQRPQLLQHGNTSNSQGISDLNRRDLVETRPAKYMRSIETNVGPLKHHSVDQNALKKAFLHHIKVLYENTNQKSRYLADGKQGRLQCAVCGRFGYKLIRTKLFFGSCCSVTFVRLYLCFTFPFRGNHFYTFNTQPNCILKQCSASAVLEHCYASAVTLIAASPICD